MPAKVTRTPNKITVVRKQPTPRPVQDPNALRAVDYERVLQDVPVSEQLKAIREVNAAKKPKSTTTRAVRGVRAGDAYDPKFTQKFRAGYYE